MNKYKNILKNRINRRKILLEDYYIIPCFSVNTDDFKLRKLDIRGTVDKKYSYEDFCNKDEKELIKDVLNLFDIKRKKQNSVFKIKNFNNTVFSKQRNGFIPDGSVKQKEKEIKNELILKKQNIRNLLIKKGFIC